MLLQIQEELDCKLKELDEQSKLAKKMIVKIEDQVYNIIDPHNGSTESKQTFQGLTNHPPKSVRISNFFLLYFHDY